MSAQRDAGAGQPVSVRFRLWQIERERRGREGRAERSLMAAWGALNTPFPACWRAAGERLREERLMGMHPPVRRVSVAALAAMPVAEIEAAAGGAHVVIDGDGGAAAVMVSAAEYDRLLVDRRLLRWERTDGPAAREE